MQKVQAVPSTERLQTNAMSSKRTVIVRPAKQTRLSMTDTSVTFISLLDTQQVPFIPLVRYVCSSLPKSDSQPISRDLKRSASPSPMKSPTSSKITAAHTRSTHLRRKRDSLGEPAPQHSPGGPHHDKCILLVDDDSTVRDSLNNVLVAEGYTVIPAENGQQALDLVNKSAVDLVMLDLNMPVKNGWDTFERLTAEHPLIPIIIVTARPNQFFMALNAGVGALLEKPMDIPTLLRTTEKLLAESAEQRLARLAGKETEFHYKPAAAGKQHSRPTRNW